jgi:hypothetical protein
VRPFDLAFHLRGGRVDAENGKRLRRRVERARDGMARNRDHLDAARGRHGCLGGGRLERPKIDVARVDRCVENDASGELGLADEFDGARADLGVPARGEVRRTARRLDVDVDVLLYRPIGEQGADSFGLRANEVARELDVGPVELAARVDLHVAEEAVEGGPDGDALSRRRGHLDARVGRSARLHRSHEAHAVAFDLDARSLGSGEHEAVHVGHVDVDVDPVDVSLHARRA